MWTNMNSNLSYYATFGAQIKRMWMFLAVSIGLETIKASKIVDICSIRAGSKVVIFI